MSLEHSQSFAELAKALSAAQGEMTSAAKDRENSHFKTKYATLDSVIDAVRSPLAKNGLSIVQSPGSLDEVGIPITTMLMHSSGEYMRSTMHVPLGKRDAQGIGSALSYGRRYSLMSILGISTADDDDDGEAVTAHSDQNGGNRRHQTPPRPPAPNGNGNGSGRRTPPAPPDPRPNPHNDIEAFGLWLRDKMSAAKDLDDLADAWNRYAEDIFNELIPPDQERLSALYIRFQERLS